MTVASPVAGTARGEEAAVRTLGADHLREEAITDLVDGLRRYEVWTRFAVHEIRQRFRRSLLGPFWLTASMGVFVASLGLISSTVFHQDMHETLPYIATGIIFWGLVTGCITEGTTVFISRESYIRNVPLPLSVHLYQMLARNLIIWGFNMVIYLLVLVFFAFVPGWNVLWFLLGAPLLVINLAWMSLAAGILSTRYRDIPQVIQSVIQIVFFLTPIFWSVKNMPDRPHFVALNPMYHLLEVVREPLLGAAPSLISWLMVLGMAIMGCLFTAWLYRRAQPRIAYWV